MNSMPTLIEVKNTPAYAAEYALIVYRMSKGERWFYGAYNDAQKAAYVAAEIGGFVAKREEVKT